MPALLAAIALLALLVPAIAAVAAPAEAEFELVLETRKVNRAGGSLNRYSFTDADGNGYGLYLNSSNGRLTIERRDAWSATALATSAALSGGMALGRWYTLSLTLQGGQLTAEAYVDAATTVPAVTVTANDSSYTAFTQFGVNGGRVFDTDNIRIFATGALDFAEDFDDGDISGWVTFRSGQIDLQKDGSGGFVLRKSGFNDPNGGVLALPRTLALAAPPLEFEAVLTTRKVNTWGGNNNRYSVTDANGNGYGVFLNFNNSKLTLERRDAWAATTLATSTDILKPQMDLFEWFTLALYRQGNQVTAEAYRGKEDPAARSPEIELTATDSTYNEFTSFGVHGGYDYDTDDIRVRVDGQIVLEDNFDDGNIEAWQDFESGVIGLESDGTGFVLRKSGFNDPNGGTVGLVPPTLDVTLAALKADTTGGNLIRYSASDSVGDGYGVYLRYPSGKLTIERRDAWIATELATSSGALPGGVALNKWYTLTLGLKDGGLTAEAFVGRVDPAVSTPAVTVAADDSDYSEFTQFNVNGGHVFYTDDILVRLDGELALAENFDDGDISDWEQLGLGVIDLVSDGFGGSALGKFTNNDPNGGFVGLIPGFTLLTFDPATDGVTDIGDYRTEYGIELTGAALSSGAAFPQDGYGIQNAAALAVVEFVDSNDPTQPAPVGYVELSWVRLEEEVDFAVTALDVDGNTQYYFLSEACPLFDCSLSPLSGTEIIRGEGIVRLEFEGTPPGGSTLDRSDPIVGLDALGFAPEAIAR